MPETSPRLSVPMHVMYVRNVRMSMPDPDMPVRMRMRLACRIVRTMFMLMMFIMNMGVIVKQRIVLVRVFVMFSQMQPDAERH